MVKYISLYGLSQIAMIRGFGFVILHVSYSSFDTCKTYSIEIYLGFEELCDSKGGMLHLMWTCNPPPAPDMGPFNSAISNKEADGPGGRLRPLIPSLIPGVWNAQYIY